MPVSIESARSQMSRNHLTVPQLMTVMGHRLVPPISRAVSSASSAYSGASREHSLILSASNTFISEDEDSTSERYTARGSISSLNQVLETQVATMKQQIASNQEHYHNERRKIQEEIISEIQKMDAEINGLKEALSQCDENMQQLQSVGDERDLALIDYKAEIDDLKGTADQFKDDIQNIEALMREHQRDSDKNMDGDSQDQEMSELRARLAAAELELAQAIKEIELQNERLAILVADKSNSQARFREELAKMSTRMRQDVEIVTELMLQNYQGMKEYRDQNRKVFGVIGEIGKLLEEYKAEAKSRPHGDKVVSRFPLIKQSKYPPASGRDSRMFSARRCRVSDSREQVSGNRVSTHRHVLEDSPYLPKRGTLSYNKAAAPFTNQPGPNQLNNNRVQTQRTFCNERQVSARENKMSGTNKN